MNGSRFGSILVGSLMAFVIVVLVIVVLAPPASAKTHYVEIGDNWFSPEHITISLGDQITWQNNGSISHTVTEDRDAWDSGNVGSGSSWSYTFNTAQNWSYYCKYHGGQTGTINVNEAPELNNGTVDPSTGDSNTLFNFTVTYMDANSNAPQFIYVNIDGTNYSMAKTDAGNSDYENGVEYYYETTLGDGMHSYYFIANDHYVTNSTDSQDTGTVVPEFTIIVVVGAIAVGTVLLISFRRRRIH